jgi:hypothetical protein
MPMGMPPSVYAGKLTVPTDVSGIVVDVPVKESQKVENGAGAVPPPTRTRSVSPSRERRPIVAYANDFKLMMAVALVGLPLLFPLRHAQGAAGGDRPCQP